MANDRVTQALRYVEAEISVSHDEFRRDNQPDGNDLLLGMINNGYLLSQGGRVAASTPGRRRLAHVGGAPP